MPPYHKSSSIGGNVAECAGGPRAFKYGTTKRYVLALEAVLPTGEIVRTGSKAVKNVVGYDLSQLLVGSEGTLAIITRVTLRLIPRPPVRATLSATFGEVRQAVDAVTGLISRRVVPAAIELVDGESLRAVEAYLRRTVVPAGANAMIIVECDGGQAAVDAENRLVEEACRDAGAMEIRRSASEAEREDLWGVRRQLSLALRATGLLKINHDVVVPRGRIPQLLDAVGELAREYRLRVASFGHAGDGNIHTNLMVAGFEDPATREKAEKALDLLFAWVLDHGGAITGEHGIGLAKKPWIHQALGDVAFDVHLALKDALDPQGILNPGKFLDD